ncbi:PepSY domain-containing protein [Paenibacillus sp. Soil522]|uniref:PepSY domain-containing protein n=1 Tax=Paenibacillus sp. Soil522 TaxID=1736388 RepID=UPI0006F7E40B|nr:PepSY domain-containing protein [Paenibacillus sp. Soil522]KRE40927.1 hypothetical protein ASG81_16960 [Paenibacillus sp. Soil522]
MKERFILRIGFCLLAYLIALSIFNKPSISFEEAAQIAEKVTPISDGYHISQISGRNNWSFLFATNPVYRFNVIAIKTESGFQHREYKVEIDAKTKEVVEIKEIN